MLSHGRLSRSMNFFNYGSLFSQCPPINCRALVRPGNRSCRIGFVSGGIGFMLKKPSKRTRPVSLSVSNPKHKHDSFFLNGWHDNPLELGSNFRSLINYRRSFEKIKNVYYSAGICTNKNIDWWSWWFVGVIAMEMVIKIGRQWRQRVREMEVEDGEIDGRWKMKMDEDVWERCKMEIEDGERDGRW